tara:strand:+ start:3643 stop:4836 length:1194 start_codon:yes stop_codon:yes gene_type:complete
MDLLKFSKKITPYGMIGLILTNSITPAFAHGNHEADINSFQNSQAIVITAQVENNQEVESKNTDSLNIFQDHITGKFVSSQHVLEHGGTYNNPLNPEEVIFFNVDYKNKISREIFKDSDDYLTTLFNSESLRKLFILRDGQSSVNFQYQTDNENSPDYINLNSKEIKDFSKDMSRKGLDRKNRHYAERFILYHEFAHSMSNMEKQFNELKTKKEFESFEFKNMSESFADVLGAIAVYKDMQENKEENNIDNNFKNFLQSLMSKRTIDFININNNHNKKDPHFSTLPLFVLYDIHHNHPDLFKDMDMKQAQQLSAVIVNRTLNQEDVKEVLFENKQNNISKLVDDPNSERELFSKLSKDINNDIHDMITVNENGKVSFEYNSKNKSNILKDKPKSYKI